MTNPGSPVPPVSSTPPASSLVRGDVRATILSVPSSLQNLPRTVQLDGEVVQSNQDGSVVIRTNQGDVTAKIWTQQQPQQGQQVQLDVQAGNPPRQAVARAGDDAQTQQQTQTGGQASSPQTSSAQTSSGSSPSGQTPSPRPSSSQTSTAQNQPSQGHQQTGAEDIPQYNAPTTGPAQTAPANPALPPENTQTATAQSSGQPDTPPLSTSAVITITIDDPVTPLQTFPLQSGQAVRLLPLPPGTPILPLIEGPVQIVQPGTNAPNPALRSFAPSSNPFAHAEPEPGLLLPEHAPLSPGLPGQTAPQTSLSLASRIGIRVTDFLLNKTPAVETATPLPGKTAGIFPETPLVRPHLDAIVQSVRPPTAAQEPESLTAALPEPETPGEIPATVLGFTRQGLPVLSLTPPGAAAPQDFVLQFSASNLSPGAMVELEPQEIILPGTSPSGIPPLSLDPAEPGWPALQTLTETLSQLAPQMAEALAQTLPNPAAPAQLPAAAMLFVAAMQEGNLSGWLGNKTIDLLQRSGKTDLLSRLTGDLDTANHASSQPVTQDWKAMPLPLYYQGHVDKAMLWFRQDGGKDKDDDGKSKQTRFIFDFTLNRMGAVQLDGLAKPHRIDLILRTTASVSPSMRQFMRERFTSALDRVNCSGDLSFQDQPGQFVKIDARQAKAGFRI